MTHRRQAGGSQKAGRWNTGFSQTEFSPHMYILWYQAYILWVELVHRASAGVEVACILFQNFVNPLGPTKNQLFNTYNRAYNWSIELWVHSQALAAYAPPTKYRPDAKVRSSPRGPNGDPNRTLSNE